MPGAERGSGGARTTVRRRSPLPGVALFVAVLVALFVASGHLVTEASGSGARPGAITGVTVESGEAIFWSRGRCHTCHAVGPRGSSVRGPNLGASSSGPPIGERSERRARERRRQGREDLDRTGYLVESLLAPGDYVVEGFTDEMPAVHRPPVSLTRTDIESVILYLQSLGGKPEPDAIRLPAGLDRRRDVEPGSGPAATLMASVPADSARGRRLFFDEAGPAACSKCHAVADRGGEIGPDLTGIASVRPGRYLLESILRPAESIASGYETTVVRTTTGNLVDGIVTRESADSVWLADSGATVRAIARSRIDTMKTQGVSVMPGNYGQLLTVEGMADLLAFLLSLE